MNKVNTSYSHAIKGYKRFEEKELFHLLSPSGRTVIVRLDGHNITSSFKPTKKCFDYRLYDAMYYIVENIRSYFPYILRVYSFKDEISIVLDYESFKKDKYYTNRQEKILSILSGYVSSLFNKFINGNTLYSFDARIIYVKKNEIEEYINARKAFSTCAYFDRIFSFYNLNGNGSNKRNYNFTYLLKQKQIEPDDLKACLCFGIEGFWNHGEWIINPRKEEIIQKISSKSK